MKNINLDNFEVVEISLQEAKEIDGGIIDPVTFCVICFVVGYIIGEVIN